MKSILEKHLRITEEKFPEAQWLECVIMPDYFHALIQVESVHPRRTAYFSGFHSPMGKQIFERLLEAKRPLICCSKGNHFEKRRKHQI